MESSRGRRCEGAINVGYTVWSTYGKLVAPTWSGAHFSRSCNNHFGLQVGSLKGAGSACDENEIGTWIPVLKVNTHRGIPYGPFARLCDTCPIMIDNARAYTSLARRSPPDKRCASAGPRSTWPCDRPGELCGEPRAAAGSLTRIRDKHLGFAAKHPGPR